MNSDLRHRVRGRASRHTGGVKTVLAAMRAPRLRNLFPLALLLVVLLFGSVLAQAGEVGTEQGVVRATLGNGLRVVIVRNALAPVVATVVNYLAGSAEAPAGFPGTAHAQEHMMFRGSAGLSGDQLAAIIAAAGGEFNADTQQTVTQYFLTVPSADLDIALRIEAIRMEGVLDSEELWARERGAIEQEVAQDYSSPEFISYTRLLSAMFKGTPYAESPLGTVDSFEKTTGAALNDFHNAWYAPNNAVLVVVGDVDPQNALLEVKKRFDRIPSRKLPPRSAIHLEPVKTETIRLTTDEPHGLAMIAFRMPGYGDADYAACRVLASVLSSERGALFELVPTGKALYAGFSLDTMPQVGLGYAVAAFPKGADPDALIAEMKGILAEQVRKGFPPDLVQAAKQAARTSAELKKNSVLGLAMTWSDALTLEGKESPEAVVREIEGVSVQEVDRVAKKYLDFDGCVMSILTPESSGRPASGRTEKAGMESFMPAHPKPARLPAWAHKALNRLEIPRSAVKPVVTILPNGLKLIVQPETVSDTVSVYGLVRNNPHMETPREREGVHEVLEELFSYGTATLDRVAFQKALDDIGAGESAGTSFSLHVLSLHFERGMQLLAGNLLDPALPETAFEVVRQQVAATAAGRLQSPNYLTERALTSALFPAGDPSLRETTPETVSSLTLSDVKDYYQKVFRPDLTTIVVVGKITPEKARSVVEDLFGTWKARGPAPETFLPPVAANKSSSSSVPDSSRIQAKVAIAQTLGLTRSNSDYYALELGNHVLGGAFYATRLYRDLREETGLVYYVTSTFNLGVTRSVYSVGFGCDPANVAKARSIVVQDLKQMQKSPVNREELRRAKTLLLREIPLSESSVDQIARKLIYLSTHFLPLDEPVRAARRYASLTARDVQAAFRKWVKPGDLVQVTQGPTSK